MKKMDHLKQWARESAEKQRRIYMPSDVVAMLSEGFGQVLTPSVIRKWDYQILAEFLETSSVKKRRLYSDEDVEWILLVAVLRSLGFSIEEVRRKLRGYYFEGAEGLKLEQIKSRMDRQKIGFDRVYAFLERGRKERQEKMAILERKEDDGKQS
jgi:DNA-binding transcriptional MerR regulator